jgi:uncharacterized phage protein gp47/JayE
MPVPKITTEEFSTQLNTGIQEINPGHDTEIGPIPDIIVRPTATILEDQNDRIRQVSRLILIDQGATFQDEDVNNFVFNEAIIRNTGGRASGTVVFSRASAPTIDLPVQQNFPIATTPDESTGETVVFVTSEAKTLTAAAASSFFNIVTQRYELEVTIRATIAGTIGEVGPNRVNRPLRPLTGFDSVTNRSRTSTVVDRETNNQLLERYKISIRGTQVGTKNGRNLFIRGNFADAGDVLVVQAGDPLITRSGINGNAVDIFITGSQGVSITENQTFIGINQLIPLNSQPVLNIINVVGFILNTDYEFVQDDTGVSGSVRSQSGIKFIPGGSSPTVGTTVTIEYENDILISGIQTALDDPDNDVGGQDELARKGTRVEITIAAQLVVRSGFSFSTVLTAAETRVISFIDSLGLGADVEESDLQKEIRKVSGVDNFIFSILDRLTAITPGAGDIAIAKNEFARIESANINITP